MDTDFNRVRQIFLTIVEKPPSEWEARLDEACGNVELRRQLAPLLKAHAAGEGILDQAIDNGAACNGAPTGLYPPPTECPGAVIGQYKLLEQIGEGGFGVVFMAEQQQPVRRKVALKVLKPGMDTHQVIARFEAERQALALMDHPNIAKVLEGGQTGSGRPYFVMDLVKGLPITEYCDQNQLAPNERLELFVYVCQAVQHAHQKGIIHRDIKPSNVLVTMQDGAPLVKVIDFGIAKALGQQLTDKTLFTGFAQLIGTPLYMSPEQAALSNVDVDTRSDIYSLGVLLYELLTGTTPFDKERLKEADFDEIRRIIREEEPAKPSTRISTLGQAATTVTANRKSDFKKLSRMLRGEADWIVMKALDKDRNRRYETASAFAADVQRYLHDEPVQACPPSARYRLRKFLRRNQSAVIAAALVLLTLLVGIAGTTFGLVRAENRRFEAELAGKREENQRKVAEHNAELAQNNEHEAKERETETAAVLSFVQNKVFVAGRPKDQEGGLGHDVKLADAVKAALRFVEKSFPKQPLIEARLRMTIGASFGYLGEAKTAIEQCQLARALYTRHRGPNHPETFDSMNNLANAYAYAGRTQEALKLREETLQLQKDKLGPNHPDTLIGMHNLSISYTVVGRTQQAMKLCEETLRLRKDSFGLNHPDTLGSMHTLANAYAAAGRTQEALKLREETLQLQKAVLGPEHPDTLHSMNNLALSCADAGRTQEATKLREETLPLMKVVLGPDHHDTLKAMNNLAISHADGGRIQEALELFKETLRLKKDKLGLDHPETLESMSNLANCCGQAGRVADALSLLKDALARWQRRVAADPGNTVEESYLAWTHGLLGEAEEVHYRYPAAAQAYATSSAMFDKLDQAGALKTLFFRGRMEFYRKRLALCRKAEQAVQDLDFALRQPAAEVPMLLDLRLRYLLKEQELPAALETAGKMKERAGDKAERLYDAACLYALCAGAAKNSTALLPKGPRGEELADEAMRLLKQAVAKGFKSTVHLKADPDLVPLRGREDFQKLLAELTAKKE
jgi:serine/threonine protein kinase/tetratricopeptide (TPR) repeat protein